jgi:hypothetical protein
MARRQSASARHVTGSRSVGNWTVNSWNSGLGQSNGREIEGAEKQSGDTGRNNAPVHHVLVTPCFHATENTQKKGKPYFRLLSLLEELAALHDLGILAPDQRAIWTAQAPRELQRDVSRCIDRLTRLSALLGGGRAGCAALWPVHLGGLEYRVHDIVRAVLGQVPPPIPFKDWSITTPAVVKPKRR